MSISTTPCDSSVARLSTPEYSLAVWVPRADAETISALVAVCFDTNADSDVRLEADTDYPLVATASFGAKDGLTTQRVKSLSARMPRAAFHLTTTFVATNKGSVLSRLTVAYRNGREVSRLCDVEGAGGGCGGSDGGELPENWVQCLAKRELESGYDYVLAFDHHWKWKMDADRNFIAFDALKRVLTTEELVDCEARESELRAQAKAGACQIALEHYNRLLAEQ